MKSVFCIHSPITYVIALSVIREKNILKTDVLFLSDGFDVPDKEIVTIDYSKKYSGLSGVLKCFVTSLGKFIDKSIDDFVEVSDFEAYVPVMRFVEKRLVTHLKCKNFSFIEEGLAHYFKEESLESIVLGVGRYNWRVNFGESFKKSVLYLLKGYNFKMQALPFSYSAYVFIGSVSFYGLDRNVFPLANPLKRRIIPLKGQGQDGVFSGANLWIGSNNAIFYKRNVKLYLDAFREFLTRIDKSKKLYVKFHRGETDFLVSQQLVILKEFELDFEVLPASFIIETVLVNSVDVNVYGLDSSLLYYARVFGQRSYSITGILERLGYYKQDDHIERDMSFYWEKVSQI